MMLRDDVDTLIADWLREDPGEASPRPAAAALAHARAHPRRRVSVRPIPSGPDAAARPGALRGLPSRRLLFAFAGLAAAAAIVLVVSFGLLVPVRLPSGLALPVAAPSASAETTYSAELPALTGTWTGTVTEDPQLVNGSGAGVLGGDPDMLWGATLTFDACDIGVACGSMELRTSDYRGSGTPKACRIVLTLTSPDRAGPWATFTEERDRLSANGPGACDLGSLDVKVSTGGTTGHTESLMLQEFRGGILLRQGLLTRSPTP